MVGKDVDGVGIDNHRTLAAPDLRDHGDGGLFIGAQTWSYTNGVIVFCFYGFREDGLIAIQLDDGLWHTHLHDYIVLLGRVGCHLSFVASTEAPPIP